MQQQLHQRFKENRNMKRDICSEITSKIVRQMEQACARVAHDTAVGWALFR